MYIHYNKRDGMIYMKSQIDFVYDFDNDPVDEVKHWLFLESVRIEQDRQELEGLKRRLEEDRESFEKYKKEQTAEIEAKIRKLDREKELFDKQWKVIEKELKRIAKDNERIASEKEYLEIQKRNFRKAFKENGGQSSGYGSTGSGGGSKGGSGAAKDIQGFFVGTTGLVSVRKRYKELLKIFHPDNLNGDNSVITQINKEYEELVRRYKG